ncbi:hypothetical protein D8674_000523 [Pyrus ussuriensis x Pyrus communis]|uniref:B3 domain-containing protein n=1 Tax=Pyrus ussuriensis x Pyrus communis TaxID=2448454 RepID=A0A5N5F4C2_9ROSA|nr:hypothetical protein D8674_000523 [Pyrus ussuriensis x Pyrus communis]
MSWQTFVALLQRKQTISLLEGCKLPYPTKTRSKHRINSIDQKLSLASNNAATTQSHYHHHTNNVSMKIKCDKKEGQPNLNMKKKRITMNKEWPMWNNEISTQNFQQTESKNFLKRNDMDRFKKDKLEQLPISLGLWKMSSNSKTEESDDPKRTYVLKSQWNHIVKKHRLGKGDVVQVWSFQAIPKDTENGTVSFSWRICRKVLEEERSKGSLAIASTNGRSSSVCNNGASGSAVSHDM